MIFNKDKVYLAFYKGNDKLLDKIITWTSRGIYSHVEIIIDNVSYSSSGRDGGVRRKTLGTMHYNDINKWDIFELKVEDINLFKDKFNMIQKQKRFGSFSFQKHDRLEKNGKYDYWSIILYHILRIPLFKKIQNNRFLCTELILEIIQFCLSIDYIKVSNNTVNKLQHKAFNEGFKTTPTNVLELLISLELINRKISNEEVKRNGK